MRDEQTSGDARPLEPPRNPGVPALAPELERRIQLLEDPANQGAEFDLPSWTWLLLLGLALPAALVLWVWT